MAGLLTGLMIFCLSLGLAQAHGEHGGKSTHPFVVSGVVLNAAATERMKAFADILGRAAGYALAVDFVDSYSALSEALRNDPNALGWTCGAPFVEDRLKDGQQLIGVPLFRGQPTYHSLVITRRGRPEKSLLDFRGKVLAYSDIRSNSSYVSPAYTLRQAGYDMETFFRFRLHTGNHERSIVAVANGLADVAAVDEYVWVEYLRANPDIEQKVKIIERQGPFPFTPIVAGRGLDAGLVERLQRALVGLKQDRQGRKLLDEFGLDGFVTVSDDFYQPIEAMLRTLKGRQQAGGR